MLGRQSAGPHDGVSERIAAGVASNLLPFLDGLGMDGGTKLFLSGLFDAGLGAQRGGTQADSEPDSYDAVLLGMLAKRGAVPKSQQRRPDIRLPIAQRNVQPPAQESAGMRRGQADAQQQWQWPQQEARHVPYAPPPQPQVPPPQPQVQPPWQPTASGPVLHQHQQRQEPPFSQPPPQHSPVFSPQQQAPWQPPGSWPPPAWSPQDVPSAPQLEQRLAMAEPQLASPMHIPVPHLLTRGCADGGDSEWGSTSLKHFGLGQQWGASREKVGVDERPGGALGYIATADSLPGLGFRYEAAGPIAHTAPPGADVGRAFFRTIDDFEAYDLHAPPGAAAAAPSLEHPGACAGIVHRYGRGRKTEVRAMESLPDDASADDLDSGDEANLEAAALAQQRVAQDARGLPVRTMDSLLGGDFASRLYTSTMDDLDTLEHQGPDAAVSFGASAPDVAWRSGQPDAFQ